LVGPLLEKNRGNGLIEPLKQGPKGGWTPEKTLTDTLDNIKGKGPSNGAQLKTLGQKESRKKTKKQRKAGRKGAAGHRLTVGSNSNLEWETKLANREKKKDLNRSVIRNY